MPDVPTLKELGYDVEFSLWVGVFAPKGTPAPVVKVLREAIKQGGAQRSVQDRHQQSSAMRSPILDQAEFAKFWDEDAKRVEAAVHAIGRVQG